MVLYGLALAPLTQTHPEVVHAWYADDGQLQGRSSRVAAAMIDLQRLGPERGYFSEPAKIIFVCYPEDRPGAEERVQAFGFKFVDGSPYVGGFLGSEAALSEWLESQIAQWVRGVKPLAKVARRYPQTAYAGLAKSLQQEWQYLQRVVPDCGAAFEPVEEAIRSVFLPALLQAAEAECQRKLTTISIRKAGLGLPDPTQLAPGCLAAYEACTGLLVRSRREGTALDANMHGCHAGLKRRLAQKKGEAADERIFVQLLAAAETSTKRWMLHAKETGTWLTTMPNRLNATELSADEFRDSLWLRLGLAPLGLPD
jgi:hypothetical protein